MKAYKGFDKNLCCRNFQYEVGKEYTTDHAGVCEAGFHACEAPLDVLGYYGPADSRYCEVEQDGDIKKGDNKQASTKLKVVAEIGIAGLVKAHIEWIKTKIKNIKKNTGDHSAATNTGDCSAATNTGDYSAATNTGNYSAATNTGYCSAATNTGDCSAATNTGNYSAATNTGYYSAATNTGNYSAATNTGDCSAATNTGNCSAATNTGDCSAATNTGNYSAATNTGNYSAATNTGDCSAATNTGYRSAAEVKGKNSVAIVTGEKGKARGIIDCWLVLTERDDSYHIINMKAIKIDGKRYKPDTWYTLKDGKVIVADKEDADDPE